MTTFLVLGGYGYTGKLLARHLLAQSKAKVILAGRTLEKAQAFAGELDNERVSAVRVNAADADALRSALHSVDLLLVAAPTTHHDVPIFKKYRFLYIRLELAYRFTDHACCDGGIKD